MINEKKLLINYLCYILLGLVICFVGVSRVFGATLTGMKFINRSASQYPFTTTYNPTTYSADYFTFNGDVSTPNYAILNVCGTGVLGFDITNGSGHFDYLGYVEYTDKTCTVNGYAGNEYTYYFGFTQFDDAGNGNVGVSFTNYVYNVSNWTVFANFKSLTFSDSSSLDLLIQQQNLINNSTTNSQNIINNQNSNTQDIISNQDSNTQDIISSIDDNFTECRDSNNLLNLSDASSVSYNENGILQNTNYYVYRNSQKGVITYQSNLYYMKPVYLTAGTYTISLSYTYNTSTALKQAGISLGYSSTMNSSISILYRGQLVNSNISANSYSSTFTRTFNMSGDGYFWLGGFVGSATNPSLFLNHIMLVRGNKSMTYEDYGATICKNRLTGLNESISDLQNSQDSNTQNIINNQNSNTQDIIDSNKTCSTYEYTNQQNVGEDKTVLTATGSTESASNYVWSLSKYFQVVKGEVITFYNVYDYTTGAQAPYQRYCLYDDNKNLISCGSYNSLTPTNITISQNGYIRYNMRYYNPPTVKTIFKTTRCINKSDATTGAINDLNDSIMDSSSPNTDSLSGMAGWLPAGPVDSILNLPLTFLNTLNSNLGSTCSSVSVPIPFVNQSFELPCFSEYMTEHLSSFNILWTLIGGIVSVYILYNYLLGLYKWVDDTLTLRENTMPGYYDDNWGGGA